MDYFKQLRNIALLAKSREVKENLLHKKNILKLVTLLYNIAIGKIEIKNAKSLIAYKKKILQLAALNSTILEKRKIIKKTPTKILRKIILKAINNIQI